VRSTPASRSTTILNSPYHSSMVTSNAHPLLSAEESFSSCFAHWEFIMRQCHLSLYSKFPSYNKKDKAKFSTLTAQQTNWLCLDLKCYLFILLSSVTFIHLFWYYVTKQCNHLPVCFCIRLDNNSHLCCGYE